MKTQLLALAIAMTSAFSLSAQAYRETDPMVDVPSDDQVVQSVTFEGQPNRKAQAAIINMGDGSELSLSILHQKENDVRYFMVVDNDKLGLVTGGMAGTESKLAVAANGSLQIKQQNSSVGRDRWERTLTISYKNGIYVVAGFTYSSFDTLDPKSAQSCDYNLLTGKGIRDGKAVELSTKAPALQRISDSQPKISSCKGW